jgi:O-antigen ligase
MGMLAIALLIGMTFVACANFKYGRAFFVWLIAQGAIALAFVTAYQDEAVSQLLSDPQAFTGRVEIWTALVDAIKDRPLVGHGIGSVFNSGVHTPLLAYTSGWVLELPQGHNGYLDLAASVGLIGCSLVVTAFLIQPTFRLVSRRLYGPYFTAMLLSLICFIALHNLMESSLLNRAIMQWITLLIAVSIIQYKCSEVTTQRMGRSGGSARPDGRR